MLGKENVSYKEVLSRRIFARTWSSMFEVEKKLPNTDTHASSCPDTHDAHAEICIGMQRCAPETRTYTHAETGTKKRTYTPTHTKTHKHTERYKRRDLYIHAQRHRDIHTRKHPETRTIHLRARAQTYIDTQRPSETRPETHTNTLGDAHRHAQTHIKIYNIQRHIHAGTHIDAPTTQRLLQ
jgi:hypothetical protein